MGVKLPIFIVQLRTADYVTLPYKKKKKNENVSSIVHHFQQFCPQPLYVQKMSQPDDKGR